MHGLKPLIMIYYFSSFGVLYRYRYHSPLSDRVDEALDEFLGSPGTLSDMVLALYCTTMVVLELNYQKSYYPKKKNLNNKHMEEFTIRKTDH